MSSYNKEYFKKYYEKNKEYFKKYYEKNKEKIKEYERKRHKEHKKYIEMDKGMKKSRFNSDYLSDYGVLKELTKTIAENKANRQKWDKIKLNCIYRFIERQEFYHAKNQTKSYYAIVVRKSENFLTIKLRNGRLNTFTFSDYLTRSIEIKLKEECKE